VTVDCFSRRKGKVEDGAKQQFPLANAEVRSGEDQIFIVIQVLLTQVGQHSRFRAFLMCPQETSSYAVVVTHGHCPEY
jgi:hypothetical protein